MPVRGSSERTGAGAEGGVVVCFGPVLRVMAVSARSEWPGTPDGWMDPLQRPDPVGDLVAVRAVLVRVGEVQDDLVLHPLL